jgi:uncharacterized protein (DUF1697 family)
MPQARKNNSLYVAFLRGINVGGHASIKMADLKAVFEKMGFQDVRTVLASGNVIFAAQQTNEKMFGAEIESGLKKTFKRNISILLRSRDHLEQLRASEPFKKIENTPGIRLYVSFLSQGAKKPSIKIPYATPRNEVRILGATATEVFSVVDLENGMGTPQAMAILEKKFGSKLTTRNWNTVLKVLM